MDIATVLGILIAATAVISAFIVEGGAAKSIFLLAPMALVIGGSFGVAIVGGSSKTVRQLPTLLKIALRGSKIRPAEMIDSIVRLAEKSRREGVLSLEREAAKLESGFFKNALLMVIDGIDANSLRDILETEMYCVTRRHQQGIDFFNRVGGFSPTLGILGTVLALVHTLSSVTEADRMATSIASAFIATLWGVGMANMVYLPIADKLKMRHEEELASLELIAEGALALQAGESPRIIRRRLQSFLAPDIRYG